jgi:hypothetical protein
LRRLSYGEGWREVRRRLWHGNPFGVIYSTFMTRTPVHASARPSGIPFLFNIRYLQAGWKLLLFRPSRFEPGAEKAHFLETQDVQGVVAAYDLSSTKEDDP